MERGFSLLEVVVALTVLAFSFSALMQIVSTTLQGTKVVSEFRFATIAAKSKLALIDARWPSMDVAHGEIDDVFSWRTVVEVYNDPAFADLVRLVPKLVTVEVWWQAGGRRHSVSFSTVMLADEGP